MIPSNQVNKAIPLDVAGSNVFGQYSKISSEQTFNMYLSDDWLVPFPGYKVVSAIAPSGVGRGIHSSIRFNNRIAVIDNGVYVIASNNSFSRIGSIDTFIGDVFIAENNNDQIAICDKKDIWIFNYVLNTFAKAVIDFEPAYICFQGSYFIAPVLGKAIWRLSDFNNGLSWPSDSSHIGAFQDKPNDAVAAIPLPGKGNVILLLGETVTQIWSNIGLNLFPYELNVYNNIDYGCINSSTIAQSDNFVAWVGINEKSGPFIMASSGSQPIQISTDGINFKLSHLTNPSNCFGSMLKIDGHLFYQVTWPDDELTYIYDFNTSKFYTLTDHVMGAHPALRYVFFNGKYYFISRDNGNVYEINSDFTDYDGEEIPRVRVTRNFRLPDSSRFIVNNLEFTIEQGITNDLQRVDMSISKNGGYSFGNILGKNLNKLGTFRNRLIYWNLGQANDLVFQFRFWGFKRFLATNGIVNIYQ